MFLDSAPFDLRELVEGVAELLVVRAEAKGVQIVLDRPPEAPRRLVGDRNRLRQVLMNLVGNAVKFTEQGAVTIRARLQPAADGQVRLTLAVVDTGIGVALEAQSRIFERFVQADRLTGRRYGGTGLGLNIARSLIELMGGRLTLQSEPGRGSTFEAELTLPLAPTQPAPDFGEASLAGVDVVLLQRDTALREVNAGLLRFAGASVRTAGTAADGLALIAEHAPHVLAVGERLTDSSGVDSGQEGLARSLWRRVDHPRRPDLFVAHKGGGQHRHLRHRGMRVQAGETDAADSRGAAVRRAGSRARCPRVRCRTSHGTGGGDSAGAFCWSKTTAITGRSPRAS